MKNTDDGSLASTAPESTANATNLDSLSLLDYFAGLAVSALPDHFWSSDTRVQAAALAYDVAEAMLEERNLRKARKAAL